MLWLGIGWLTETMKTQAKARTRHRYDCSVVFDRDGSTHSVKLSLSKYSVDGSSGQGSWTLLECLAQAGGSDKESQEGAGEGYDDEDEEEDEEED